MAAPQNQQSVPPVLSVESLHTYFVTKAGVAPAVDGVSFELARGETLAIVGESGCGKSVTAMSIMRLLPTPPAQILGGPVLLDGKNLLSLSNEEMRRVRGNEISMIFQEPMTSLNPVLTIGEQLAETIMLHQGVSNHEALDRCIEALQLVQIPDPKTRLKLYPFELSGGMRQRVMIAMALSCSPKVLIADEPTTALDVTIQAQILDLINELKEKTGTAVIMITHDLGVVAETAQRVLVMYAGKVVEQAWVADLFSRPIHPYTQGLLASIPKLGSNRRSRNYRKLPEIKGTVPALTERPQGCVFAPRCPLASARCRTQVPPLQDRFDTHSAACWNADMSLEEIH